MDQRACVNLPALPLQILFRQHPDWRTEPAVVVDHDKPQGLIQWSNERARSYRILPGMRYAAGLALARELRASVITDREIAREVVRLTRRLEHFSPLIEPSAHEAGIFWLDANGLKHVFPSLEAWTTEIRNDLQEQGFQSVIAVGWSRFGSYAGAKAGSRNILYQNPEEERNRTRPVPIDRLEFEPKLREKLNKLGVRTIGAFVDLPAAGIRKRFGPVAYELHRLAAGKDWSPVDARPLREPVRQMKLLDYPETNLDRLQYTLRPLVKSILSSFSERSEAVSSLRFSLTLDDGQKCQERLSPASPTLDERQLMSLIRLRIESLPFSAGVIEMKLQGAGVPVSEKQLELFQQQPRRDLAAVHRSLALVRAELGNSAIQYARLAEGHLPEARYEWRPFEKFTDFQPTKPAKRPLIRRLFTPPIQLAARSRHEPDGWLVSTPADGPVEEVFGPYIVSGGWWRREISRAYHYVRTRSGRWLWIYYDHRRKRWFLQGEVE
jgi:protein ImuB